MRQDELKALFEQYSSLVYGICRRYSSSSEEAKDLSQDVFILLGRKWHLFRGNSKDSTWIYKITIHRCLDYLRLKKRRNELDMIYLDEVVVHNLSADDQVTAKIDLEKILGGLKRRTRWILFLSLAEGLSYAEVAEILNLTKSAVAKTVERFMERVRGQHPEYAKSLTKRNHMAATVQPKLRKVAEDHGI